MFGDDTDKIEKDNIPEEKPLPTYSGYAQPVVEKTAASPQTSDPGPQVSITNLTKGDVHILIEGEQGQSQQRIGRLATFGPIPKANLTPQVHSLAVNKRIRIIES